MKKSVVDAATGKGKDAAEAVLILDNAFAAVKDVDFLGQASKNNGKNYRSMQVKLRFPDRESRIYFENTVRKLGGA